MPKNSLTSWISEQAQSLFKKKALEAFDFAHQKIIGAFNNKKISVLGTSGSGKDSFFSCLQGKNPKNSSYVATTGVNTIKSFPVNRTLPDRETICFEVNESLNVGGEEEEKERYWGIALEQSDLIFYLIDFPKILDELDELNLENEIDDKISLKLALKRQNKGAWRFLEDMRFIHSQSKHNGKKEPSILILLNKFDEMNELELPNNLRHITPDDRVEILENISTSPSLNYFLQMMLPLLKVNLEASYKNLKPVKPISCKNLEIFDFFFQNILPTISEKHQQDSSSPSQKLLS